MQRARSVGADLSAFVLRSIPTRIIPVPSISGAEILKDVGFAAAPERHLCSWHACERANRRWRWCVHRRAGDAGRGSGGDLRQVLAYGSGSGEVTRAQTILDYNKLPPTFQFVEVSKRLVNVLQVRRDRDQKLVSIRKAATSRGKFYSLLTTRTAAGSVKRVGAAACVANWHGWQQHGRQSPASASAAVAMPAPGSSAAPADSAKSGATILAIASETCDFGKVSRKFSPAQQGRQRATAAHRRRTAVAAQGRSQMVHVQGQKGAPITARRSSNWVQQPGSPGRICRPVAANESAQPPRQPSALCQGGSCQNLPDALPLRSPPP